ncbi:glycosyltransferase family 4 protein [Daejeonella lutea]|uniref:Glycosyltransferase involved in cell wall bisynthesis n=1 Tax=Daejeonella lutea TaxID=572036 RepID=A0A1T5EEQ0_9SPHI|nr:glycosyltransferase [Daejeonella lutea]SKB82329.1 Glycosyltransferase involved in cell wall bisynthesis [Daejeonella lutea]
MNNRLTIYIVGDFKSEAADGLAEFSYQNVKLLRDEFIFEFVEFDALQPEEYYKLEVREGIDVHRFGVKGLTFFTLPTNYSKWIKGLNKSAGLFHLHHIWNIRNYLIARHLIKNNIPYLITPHDSYVYSKSYNLSRPLFKRLYRRAFVLIFDKYVLDHARVVHALTNHCVPSLQLITHSRIEVVENQISDPHIPLSIASVKMQVCFIGRFNVFQKGIDLALRAFGLFKNNGTNPGVQFVLVGPGDKHAINLVKSLCEDLRLEIDRDVFFPGKVSEVERNSFLQESMVYMQLSRHEGFGLSVVQALASYKPVIVSEGIPIGETIEKYNAGYVVENTQEAAEALHKIFTMPTEEYLQMANNARRCYLQEFHSTVIKPKLISLYTLAAVK